MFHEEQVLEKFSSQDSIDVTSSLQVRILIFSKELGYLF